MFACENIGDKWYLSADLQEECLVGRHLWWMTMFGLPQLGAYVIGMPCLAYLILLFNRWRLHKKRVRFRYGLLYSGYRRRTFWWEGVVAMRKVAFVVIAGVFGSRMGPDLQCFVALFALFWFFNFHLSAHPFDEISKRHKVLHTMETWALIVAWCTMWMGLIFYLGNEYGRINRDWMVVFTVSIIGMNALYCSVVLFLFSKEYIQEKIEAKRAQDHEKLVSKLAAHMYATQRIEDNMETKISKNDPKQLHSLDPRRVGRNSLGANAMNGILSKVNGESGGQALINNAAANVLAFSQKNLSKSKKDREARKMQKLLKRKTMSSEEVGRMEQMLINQQALESVSDAIRLKEEKVERIKKDHDYHRGRLQRRLKMRSLQRAMVDSKVESDGKGKANHWLSRGKTSFFNRLMHRNESTLAKRIKAISKINASMRVARECSSEGQYIKVKFWGVPPGVSFTNSRDGFSLRISSIKTGSSVCPSEGRSVLKAGDTLIDVNGKDVRGIHSKEARHAYLSITRDQSNRSTSEDPPMWYLILRRGPEGEGHGAQATFELAEKYPLSKSSRLVDVQRQEEERRRAKNNRSSASTTLEEEMNANDPKNAINNIDVKKLRLPRKRMMRKKLNVAALKIMPSGESSKNSGDNIWQRKIAMVLSSSRIDPDTNEVMQTQKRRKKLAQVQQLLAKYKGNESKLLLSYFKKYRVPEQERDEIMKGKDTGNSFYL